MIGSIRGKIALKREKFILVETGGVGYKISISPDTLSRLSPRGTLGKNEVFLFIHTHVR